ncbi:MAG: hypothetical protein ABL882_05275 [Sphingopyxis sp.]
MTKMKKAMVWVSLTALAISSIEATAMAQAAAEPVPQTSIYFTSEDAMPEGVTAPDMCSRPAGDPSRASLFVPIIGFLFNFLFEEGLEAINRAQLARIEAMSDSYVSLRNLAALPDLSNSALFPGHPVGEADRSECLVIAQRADIDSESALTNLFIFEVSHAGTSAMALRPVLVRINSTPANARARDKRVSSTIAVGMNALVPQACEAAAAACAPAKSVQLGTSSFSFGPLVMGTEYRCDRAVADTPHCAQLGGQAAMMAMPGRGNPITIAASVANTSVELRDAQLRQKIWERQRANLLAALNSTVDEALN